MNSIRPTYFCLGVVLLSLSFSCKQEPLAPTPLYSFFAAGHTYGFVDTTNVGIHDPFQEKFPFLNDYPNMDMGFLLGDMVRFISDSAFDDVDRDLMELKMPVYKVVGNHEVGFPSYRTIFTRRYGDTYSAFVYQNDLFLLLDSNMDKWNISGDQWTFVQEQVNQYSSQIDRIFVMFHEVIWWSPTNVFRNFKPNYLGDRADSVNFWTEVQPFFDQSGKPVVFFAGDVGVFTTYGHDSYMYYQEDSLTYIATGMGNEQTDNFIIVDVMSDKSIRYRLVALNGDDMDALGKLEDYMLP